MFRVYILAQVFRTRRNNLSNDIFFQFSYIFIMIKDSQITNYLNLIKRLNKQKQYQRDKSLEFKYKSYKKENSSHDLKEKRMKFLKAAISDVQLKIGASDKSKRSNIYSKYFQQIQKKKQKHFKTQMNAQCSDILPRVARYPSEQFDGKENTCISKTESYTKKNRTVLTELVKKEQNIPIVNQNIFYKKNTVTWRASYKNLEEKSIENKSKQMNNNNGLGVVGVEALCSEDFSRQKNNRRKKTLSNLCKKLSNQRKQKFTFSKIIEKRNGESRASNFFSNGKIEGWKNEQTFQSEQFI